MNFTEIDEFLPKTCYKTHTDRPVQKALRDGKPGHPDVLDPHLSAQERPPCTKTLRDGNQSKMPRT
jgi:hypothetical protein